VWSSESFRIRKLFIIYLNSNHVLSTANVIDDVITGEACPTTLTSIQNVAVDADGADGPLVYVLQISPPTALQAVGTLASVGVNKVCKLTSVIATTLYS
jgi:hypothetical protein